MPFYDYECTACGNKFEATQTVEEHDRHVDHDRHEPLKCPRCASEKVGQLLASAVFVITSKKS